MFEPATGPHTGPSFFYQLSSFFPLLTTTMLVQAAVVEKKSDFFILYLRQSFIIVIPDKKHRIDDICFIGREIKIKTWTDKRRFWQSSIVVRMVGPNS